MALIELARAQVGDAVREEGLPRHEMVNVLVAAGEASLAITGDRWKLAEGVYQAIGAQAVDRSTLLSMKGQLYVEYAGDGGGVDEVAGGKTPAEQRQEIAQKLLEEAWRLIMATHGRQLWAMRLRGGAGRPATRRWCQWFRRTLEADPDMLEAYREMKDYLLRQPTRDAALRFGRECVRWLADRSEARLMIVDIHMAATGPTWVPDSAADQPYFRSEAQIWKDVSAAYEPFIKSRKVSQHHSIRYALMAMWCGQWNARRNFWSRSRSIVATARYPPRRSPTWASGWMRTFRSSDRGEACIGVASLFRSSRIIDLEHLPPHDSHRGAEPRVVVGRLLMGKEAEGDEQRQSQQPETAYLIE